MNRTFMEISKILWAEYMKSCCWKGAYPGVDIGQQPDEVDEVDSDDVVGGVGVDKWKTDFDRSTPTTAIVMTNTPLQ